MRTIFNSVLACVMMAAVLGFSGCNKNKEEVYIAPPPPPAYPVIENKEKGFSYAIMQEGVVLTKEVDKWNALSPELFAKLSGITVKAPEPNKAILEGYGYILPKIETSSAYPERKMTAISASYLVPKELNGWVAVSQETFEKLAKEFMTSKK
ncbi:MAG: hypothetical protein WCT04_25970 [Planctomycetota bacterium]